MNRSVNVRSGYDNRVPTVSSETVASGLRVESTFDVVGRSSTGDKEAKGSEDESPPVRASDADRDGTDAGTFVLFLVFLEGIRKGDCKVGVVYFTLFDASQRSSHEGRAHHLVQQSQSRACSHRYYRSLLSLITRAAPSSLPAPGSLDTCVMLLNSNNHVIEFFPRKALIGRKKRILYIHRYTKRSLT